MKTIKILVTCKVEDEYQLDDPQWDLEDAVNNWGDIVIIDCKYVDENKNKNEKA